MFNFFMVLLCVIIKRVWYAGHFEYSSMRCSCTTENKRHCDLKKLRKRLLTIKTRNIIRWNIYRDNNCYSRRQVLRVKCFWNPEGHIQNLADINRLSGVCYFFKMNSRQEYLSKLSFFTTNILQNVFSLFVVKKCLKAFKALYIKPGMILGQIIVSNLKNLQQKLRWTSWNYQGPNQDWKPYLEWTNAPSLALS